VADQELLATVAVALATKTAEGVVAGGRAAFEALARLVRRRFEGRKAAEMALAEGGSSAGKEARIEILRQALIRAVAEDPAFEAELQSHWRELTAHLNLVGGGGVVNSVPGTVEGDVVQARDVHGGISFGKG
jgi:hypothetical protein